MAEKEKPELQGPALFPAWYVNEKLEQLTQDPATGLLNQVAWKQAVQRRVSDAEAGKAQPAIFSFDITRFKQVNDRHGHPAGDNLILAIAEMLKDSLRHKDTPNADIARIGGDEFAVLLDLIPRENGNYSPEERVQIVKNRVAERVNELMKKEPFNEYKDLGVDLAIGSRIWEPGISAEQLIGASDEAMYKEKDHQHELSPGKGREAA